MLDKKGMFSILLQVIGITEKNTPFEPIYFPMYSLFSPFSRTLIHILI